MPISLTVKCFRAVSSFSAAFVPRGESMGEFDEKYWQQKLRVVIYVVT